MGGLTRLLFALALGAALTAVPSASALRPAPGLHVAPGLAAELYATGLHHPTALAFGPGGVLYATQDSGELVAVGRGSARPRILLRGLHVPLGLAWAGNVAYVSTQGALLRLVVRKGRVVSRQTILGGLPYGLHQQDTVALGPDGRLYLGSGSTCNACGEDDLRSATILSVRPDGSDLQIVATGLRNPYGLAFQPGTGALYASVNGRDDLGAAEPAEIVVRVRRGADFGWPGCWSSWAKRRLEGRCGGVTKPVALLEPHSSADSLAFWRGGLVVAEWGQYLSERWGRKLVRVDVRTGRSTTLATGFEHPLGLAVERKGGGLLVGDWGRGAVYRLTKR